MGYELRRWGCRDPRAGWQLLRGISGNFLMEWVATFVWNQWQFSHGMGGNFAVESVATFAWNMQVVEADDPHGKCLSKMNFIFVAEPFDHFFDILNQAGKVGISPEFDPFVLHKTPKNLYEIQFGRICRQVENP